VAVMLPTQSTGSSQLLASPTAAHATDYELQDISVAAEAAYVLDASSGEVLYDKSALAQLPLASITKVAVALLAHTHLNSEGVLTISEENLLPEGDSGFEIGEQWRVRDLIDFTLLTSSNDGAATLARAIEKATGKDIAILLNEQAKELGLAQTYFINATGLDSSTSFGGAYGSARDIAKLFVHVYRVAPELLAATNVPEYTFTNLNGKVYEASNTNKVVPDLPGLVFGKTGFTDLAGGNLAVLIEPEPGHPLVVVVLGSTQDERFKDVVRLVHTALQTTE